MIEALINLTYGFKLSSPGKKNIFYPPWDKFVGSFIFLRKMEYGINCD
jgi:hypothetical protein